METEVSTHWTEFAIYNNVVYPFTTGITFPGFTFCLFAVMKWLQTTIPEILNARETDAKAIPLCLHLVPEGNPESRILEIHSCRIRWALETGIQAPLAKNREFSAWNPKSMGWNPESKTQDNCLGFPYMGQPVWLRFVILAAPALFEMTIEKYKRSWNWV